MNAKQLAIIKKDIASIAANKQALVAMIAVPVVFTIVVPTVFVLTTVLDPASISEFELLLKLLILPLGAVNLQQLLLELIFNRVMPLFFLLIPIMASSVMAAGSFVGEKEKHTLETLLYAPLTVRQLFQAKILAGFAVGMMVSLGSFAAMTLVVETELYFLTGATIAPDLSWLIAMLLIAPAISIIAIAITVRGSAKAKTMEEAQQKAVFLVLPVLALVVAQLTGFILFDPAILAGLGAALVLFAVLLMRGIAGKLTYENLLK